MLQTPPKIKPHNPHFSSGPSAKPPGWTPQRLEKAMVGRSHRSEAAIERIQEVCNRIRELLCIPQEFKIVMAPASTTGAFTMGLWSLLGARGVDVFAWEVFGKQWALEIQKGIQLRDVRLFEAPLGLLPELNQASPDRDIVFTWNGTTSGICVPNGNWIPKNRSGLVFCDAISAIFSVDIPWENLDVTAFSWQKTLGGESGIGILVLSPRALKQLEIFTPSRPIPGILNLKDYSGTIKQGLFHALPANTVSMLCIEDFLIALRWAEDVGGLNTLKKRTEKNFLALSDWVKNSQWVDFLASNSQHLSKTSTCLKIIHPQFQDLEIEKQWECIKALTNFLEQEKVAYDLKNHQSACPSLRIWSGPTIETSDIKALLPWLDWGFQKVIYPILVSSQSKKLCS